VDTLGTGTGFVELTVGSDVDSTTLLDAVAVVVACESTVLEEVVVAFCCEVVDWDGGTVG
jgi:hypothetical protein